MDLVVPPSINVAAPRLNDFNRSAGRVPVKQAPIPEPAESPSRVSQAKVRDMPISLPPTVDSTGHLAKPTNTGTRVNLLA